MDSKPSDSAARAATEEQHYVRLQHAFGHAKVSFREGLLQWTKAQLEGCSMQKLRQRALDLRDALGLTDKVAPIPCSSIRLVQFILLHQQRASQVWGGIDGAADTPAEVPMVRQSLHPYIPSLSAWRASVSLAAVARRISTSRRKRLSYQAHS
jgi:hypothetical protein